MLARRIIACLDVRDGVVVKGTRFRDHEVVGTIADLVDRYREDGADEIVFYDITASAEQRRVDRRWVEAVARRIDIPFCVAGGIRSVEDARELLGSGADKISVNSPALERPSLIEELAAEFGRQCVVIGVDSQRNAAGDWRVFAYTGHERTTQEAGRSTLEWLTEVERRGAGEVVLNCMDRDGTGDGYDLVQLCAARSRLSIPLVASGGARWARHFVELFGRTGADAALAAGALHRGELTIGEVKSALRAQAVEVR